MSLPKIISLSGKKHCGKSLLANIAHQYYGYDVISFANGLKKLVCECLDINIQELNEIKDYTHKVYYLDNHIPVISRTTGIDTHLLQSLKFKQFNSIREILQYIGTDIIRCYNPEWHTKQVEQIIRDNPYKRFCIDDTRFVNEKVLLESLGAEMWYIKRNTIHTDAHISENQLSETDFSNIIENNSTKVKFKDNWIDYLMKLSYKK